MFVALGPNVTPKGVCFFVTEKYPLWGTVEVTRFHLTFSRGIANSCEEPESLYSECSVKPHVPRQVSTQDHEALNMISYQDHFRSCTDTQPAIVEACVGLWR